MNLLTQVSSGTQLTPEQIQSLKENLIPIFTKEKNVLELEAPIHIIGDIHADFNSLLAVVRNVGSFANQKYLFLGDYVDRGTNSHGVIQLLLCAKLCYPDQIYLLRGNHECRQIGQIYGFHSETLEKYPDSTDVVFEDFNLIFDTLPLAAVIGKKIFAVHAGLSPHLKKIEDINEINRFRDVPAESELMLDLLWSDPDTDDKTGFSESPRGVSFLWGPDQSEAFCVANSIDFVIRSHQLVMEGILWQHNNRVLTIFTSANYCGQCQNRGGYARIKEDLTCELFYLDSDVVHSQIETILPNELIL